MDASIIDILKIRSGKSFKCKIGAFIKKEVEAQIFYLTMLVSNLFKVCVILRNTDVEKYNLEEGKYVLIKNLDHCVTVSGIAVFRTTDKSVFKGSKATITNTLVFSSDEMEHMKNLSIMIILILKKLQLL